MTLARRRFLRLGVGGLAAPVIGGPAWGQTPQVTLRLHHPLTPVSSGHTKFLVPWSKKVEADSAERIKIDIFPSMQLGGAPAQLYDQARDGIADIVWTLPANTPGRFPLIEAFELPFVAAARAIVNSKAVQEFALTHLKDEFHEVHPISVSAHDHGVIHTTKQVSAMENVRNLRLCVPTRLAGEALNALGAKAVGIPGPQLTEALAQRAIDGCVLPWTLVPEIKVQELVKFHTEIQGSPTLYIATFILVMNKPKYESLPPDLKKALDDNSRFAAAEKAGSMWDEQALAVVDSVRKRGNTITVLPHEEATRWRKATEPVIAAWVKSMKDKRLDGGKFLETARALIAKHDKA